MHQRKTADDVEHHHLITDAQIDLHIKLATAC